MGMGDHLRASRSAEAQYMSGWTSLLTAGDLEELREALRRGWVTSLEWEAPALRLRVRVSTQRAASVWSVPMLVRLERWTPGQYSTQLFDSVEAMLDGYCPPAPGNGRAVTDCPRPGWEGRREERQPWQTWS